MLFESVIQKDLLTDIDLVCCQLHKFVSDIKHFYQRLNFGRNFNENGNNSKDTRETVRHFSKVGTKMCTKYLGIFLWETLKYGCCPVFRVFSLVDTVFLFILQKLKALIILKAFIKLFKYTNTEYHEVVSC